MAAILQEGDLVCFYGSRRFHGKPEDWGIVTKVTKGGAVVYWFRDEETTVEHRVVEPRSHLVKLS